MTRTISSSFLLYGIDDSDKGPGKAISYAVKYALLKALGLETGDDPDEDQASVHKPSMEAGEPPEEAPKRRGRPPKDNAKGLMNPDKLVERIQTAKSAAELKQLQEKVLEHRDTEDYDRLVETYRARREEMVAALKAKVA
jgi:hypothetical protein